MNQPTGMLALGAALATVEIKKRPSETEIAIVCVHCGFRDD
jgi:hypothetical protein